MPPGTVERTTEDAKAQMPARIKVGSQVRAGSWQRPKEIVKERRWTRNSACPRYPQAQAHMGFPVAVGRRHAQE
jgi:hypothetical protein